MQPTYTPRTPLSYKFCNELVQGLGLPLAVTHAVKFTAILGCSGGTASHAFWANYRHLDMQGNRNIREHKTSADYNQCFAPLMNFAFVMHTLLPAEM
jgi:hypothetical protein